MTGVDCLATFAVADSEVALPGQVVREVVSRPVELMPAPRAPAWSLGVFSLRGVPVPVVDMVGLLGLTPTADDVGTDYQAAPCVAIIAHGARLFGFAVDRVLDVVTIDAGARHEGHRASDGLITALFTRPDGRCVYVLDVDALFALDELLSVRATAAAIGDATPADQSRQAPAATERMVILRVGEQHLALSMSVIREICPARAPVPPALHAAAYLGHVDWRGRRLTLIDPLALLYLPDVGDPTERACQVVVTLVCGELALAVDAVVDIAEVGPAARVPLDRAAATVADGATRLIDGVLEDNATHGALCLDHEAAGRDARIIAYAAIGTSGDQTAGTVAAEPRQRFAYLHFEAGPGLSTPLDEIVAVVEYPAEVTALDRGDVFVGRFVHDRHSVALVDLRGLLGGAPRAGGRVLIVDTGNRRVGFAVEEIRRIDYIEAPTSSFIERRRTSRDGSPFDDAIRLVSLGRGAGQQFLSVVHLARLAERLSAPACVSRVGQASGS
ncbi:chemotaxis protein CheW [Salinisphaera sp. Q1T1-3]|uniref:chemotaxis protein CheW n=1 Tax=Salinisphaera sp. Q1T1-3 TaxID=2321229 RepID=UPI000E751D54|nr:chemotaxis protein CheW [Salinisphaera sp. Q1T1-3]RJS92527.1 hypothetical protein D3260_11410 [Salinisphaera sp. Q1T1-3]